MAIDIIETKIEKKESLKATIGANKSTNWTIVVKLIKTNAFSAFEIKLKTFNLKNLKSV